MHLRGNLVLNYWSASRHRLYVLSYYHMTRIVAQNCNTGVYVAPGITIGRRQADGGSVTLWAMFYWETLETANHMDVTLTCTIYLSLVADHVRPGPKWPVRMFCHVSQIQIFCCGELQGIFFWSSRQLILSRKQQMTDGNNHDRAAPRPFF